MLLKINISSLAFIVSALLLNHIGFAQSGGCSGVPSLTATTGCTSPTNFTITPSMDHVGNAPSCWGNTNNDKDNGWFSFVATSSNTTISISNANKRIVLSAWTTCGGGTELGCEDSQNQNNNYNYTDINDFANISFPTTVGTTYYIQIKRRSGNASANLNGDICVYNTPQCILDAGPGGNTEDYCSTPSTLVQSTGTFSGTTSGYTDDEPGAYINILCNGASLENLSWYSFTANSSTESFNFSSVTNCSKSGGIQASILEVTYDANGCCTDFNNLDCNSNINQGSTATLTASGLTIGNQYILAIDGDGGNECDYTIAGWAPGVVLPVRLIKYYGLGFSDYNSINWRTASEVNNDYYTIEKSVDGINFENIGIVKGNGNSTSKINYEFKDYNRSSNIEYYRLSQVDYNGIKIVLGTIVLKRDLSSISVFPNPSKGELNINFGKRYYKNYNLEFIDMSGRIVTETISMNTSNTYKSMVFQTLDNGLYFLKIKDSNNNTIETIKVIKSEN